MVMLALKVSVQWYSSALVQLIFEVEDTGIGIPDTEQTRIFNAFEQQTGQSISQFGGTGLGLAIVKNLLNLMDGDISLRSKPGEGSCFQVRLDNIEVLPELEQSLDLLHTQGAPLCFEPAHLLLADDLAINRELLKAYLSHCPFSFDEAEDGLQVLECVQQRQPDAILLDIKMPEMDGETVLQRLKQSPDTRHIPVIVITANAVLEDAERYQALADSYLSKPVSRQALLKVLRQYLSAEMCSASEGNGYSSTHSQCFATGLIIFERYVATA